jgi:hypothetical protein
MVLDWNEIAVNSIVGIAQQRTERGMIRLAMVHIAIYDALNAIAGYPFTPYTGKLDVVLPASPDAAAAAAAHDVLVALFPDQQAQLDSKYDASLASIPDATDKSNGISAGRQAASAILAARAGDGRDVVVPYTPGGRARRLGPDASRIRLSVGAGGCESRTLDTQDPISVQS